MGLGPDDIEWFIEQETVSLSEMMLTLRSLSENVAKLASEVKTMKWLFPTLWGFGIALIAILVATK